MDNILVQEIDDVLKMKLPKKSSISGAEWVAVNPENTQSLPLSLSSTYRFRLPRRGYLCRSKAQTGPFFSFGLTTAGDNAHGADVEVYSAFRSFRILINGVEVHNNQYFNHFYPEWLKKKPLDWLRTDGQNFGLLSDAVSAFPAMANATVATGANPTYFTLPIPDNYSVFSKSNALPLEYLDIVVEMTLNEAGAISTEHTAGGGVVSLTMNDLKLYIPICFVDSEIDMAIKAKLEMANNNDEEMFLLPVNDVRVDSQSYDFSNTGTKTFVWNSTSSMVRLLEAKISTDSYAGNISYKTATGLSCGVDRYIYRVDGRNVSQNDITTGSGGINQTNLAYPLYQDLSASYNVLNNDSITMSPVSRTVFNGVAGAYPNVNTPLNSSFSMVANLDSVSKDLTGGVKLINNLTLEVHNAVAGVPANVYLIQHSNRIIGLSSNRCKVLR